MNETNIAHRILCAFLDASTVTVEISKYRQAIREDLKLTDEEMKVYDLRKICELLDPTHTQKVVRLYKGVPVSSPPATPATECEKHLQAPVVSTLDLPERFTPEKPISNLDIINWDAPTQPVQEEMDLSFPEKPAEVELPQEERPVDEDDDSDVTAPAEKAKTKSSHIKTLKRLLRQLLGTDAQIPVISPDVYPEYIVMVDSRLSVDADSYRKIGGRYDVSKKGWIFSKTALQNSKEKAKRLSREQQQ